MEEKPVIGEDKIITLHPTKEPIPAPVKEPQTTTPVPDKEKAILHD
jgi:hypothetical protein